MSKNLIIFDVVYWIVRNFVDKYLQIIYTGT